MTTAPAAERAATSEFWLWHGRVGVLVSMIAASLMAVVTMLAPGSHPRLLIWLAVGVVGVLSVLWFALPVIVRGRHRHQIFLVWSLCSVAVLLAATELDGGETSVVAHLLVLPILFAGLAYGHRSVVAVGGCAALGYAAIGMTDATRGTDEQVLLTATLLMVTLMAAQGARARERRQEALAELAGRLREDATHDTLTGCLNRRGFEPLVTTTLARARRTYDPVALAVVDVDWLKRINDSLGHAAGDLALTTVAAALHSQTRDTDAVARMGGDEFAVLMPGANAQDAVAVAARILNALTSRPDEPRLSVSVGIACAEHGTGDLDSLLHSADRALYVAKSAGRSCIRVDGADDARSALPVPTGRLR